MYIARMNPKSIVRSRRDIYTETTRTAPITNSRELFFDDFLDGRKVLGGHKIIRGANIPLYAPLRPEHFVALGLELTHDLPQEALEALRHCHGVRI